MGSGRNLTVRNYFNHPHNLDIMASLCGHQSMEQIAEFHISIILLIYFFFCKDYVGITNIKEKKSLIFFFGDKIINI